MKQSIGIFFGALAVAASLSACNNGSSSSGPTSGPACPNPPYNLEVLYPRPGAGAVNPAVGGVVVAFSNPLPVGNQYDLQAVQSNGSVQLTVNNQGQPVASAGSGFYGISASQIPNPHATPSYPNAIYYATNFSTPIGPIQTVALMWNDAGTGCTPVDTVATFTTAISSNLKHAR